MLLLLAYLLGIKRSGRSTFWSTRTPVGGTDQGITQYSREPDGRIVRRLTREERKKLERGAPIALYSPSAKGGIMQLDDEHDPTHGQTSSTSVADIGDRLRGDLKRCATVRGVVALFDEPRYRQAYGRKDLKAVLRKLVELSATRNETLKVMEACAFCASPPEAKRARFINLVGDAGLEEPLHWHHFSTTCIWLRPTTPRKRRLFPISQLNHRNLYRVYFDADDKLVGWSVSGKIAPLEV
ncbi:MAG: hypothetical protein AAFV45_00710 [Pseudomonadota bacterium]